MDLIDPIPDQSTVFKDAPSSGTENPRPDQFRPSKICIIEIESHLLRYLGFLTLYDEFVMQHKPRSTWTQTANLTTGNLGVSKGEER